MGSPRYGASQLCLSGGNKVSGPSPWHLSACRDGLVFSWTGFSAAAALMLCYDRLKAASTERGSGAKCHFRFSSAVAAEASTYLTSSTATVAPTDKMISSTSVRA